MFILLRIKNVNTFPKKNFAYFRTTENSQFMDEIWWALYL